MVWFLWIPNAHAKGFKSTSRIMDLIQASPSSTITCFKFTERRGPSAECSNVIPAMAVCSSGCNQWPISNPMIFHQRQSAYLRHNFLLCHPYYVPTPEVTC